MVGAQLLEPDEDPIALGSAIGLTSEEVRRGLVELGPNIVSENDRHAVMLNQEFANLVGAWRLLVAFRAHVR